MKARPETKLEAAAARPRNLEVKNLSWADRTLKEPTFRAHVARVMQALTEIGETRAFNTLLDNLVGWKNLKSWGSWGLRAIEPSMLTKMRFSAIETGLTTPMLDAGVRNAHFAQKFLEELILVARLQQDKADVSFSIGMAFMCFGPLLAPLSAAAGSAVGGGVAGFATTSSISAGKSLGQFGVTAGGKALALDSGHAATMDEKNMLGPTGFSDDWDNLPTRGRSATIYSAPAPAPPARPMATAEEKTHGTCINPVNPMQYATCLFDYLMSLNPRTMTVSERIVVEEFGGLKTVAYLEELLDCPPM